MSILDKANAAVTHRDRSDPATVHNMIAELWSAYLGDTITAWDVARMMILLKIARDKFTPKEDNLVDICGYARCLEVMGDYQ
jgi:hypothetical protein